jgi:flavin-dependent dehydrogenase
MAAEKDKGELKLDDGSRVAVLGGGPAGSFFGYFLLDMAQRLGIRIQVDLYESRDFTRPGSPGCNMCGGIVSESLVQILAVEGINLPDTVVRRGIDAYMLHLDVGSVRIETLLQEKRIGAVFRGQGPKGLKVAKGEGFDGFLKRMAEKKGVRMISGRVEGLARGNGSIQIKTRDGEVQDYHLVAAAFGVNSPALKLFQNLGLKYRTPETTKTFICEFYLGEEVVGKHLGSCMHTFLLDIPRLKFAAIIPKGDYVTTCLLGEKIDRELISAFLNAPEVKSCFPPGWSGDQNVCQCMPQMYLGAAVSPYDDRLVFIGDCGVSRLYKDGIGAAYRTAKAAASTAVFEGIAAPDFQRHFGKTCRSLDKDNRIGKWIFTFVPLMHKSRLIRRGILRMVRAEQSRSGGARPMSMVLWDIFTGSAPYRDVFRRTLHLSFLATLAKNILTEIRPLKRRRPMKEV